MVTDGRLYTAINKLKIEIILRIPSDSYFKGILLSFLLETSIKRLPFSPFSNNSTPKSEAEIRKPGIISDKTKFIILIIL